MKTVLNFSRHALSIDQISAIKRMFGEEIEISSPLSPFFTSAEDFAERVNNTIAAVVLPADLLLECISREMITSGTVLLFWRADEEARKRGNHASTSLIRYEELMDGRWSREELVIAPTVEVSFKDGAVYPYGG